jgi:hypothetical protein
MKIEQFNFPENLDVAVIILAQDSVMKLRPHFIVPTQDCI